MLSNVQKLFNINTDAFTEMKSDIQKAGDFQSGAFSEKTHTHTYTHIHIHIHTHTHEMIESAEIILSITQVQIEGVGR